MKARLADALWSCLETRRLSEVSVGDVIERAEVSRGSFYYHFPDLDALVAWAVARELLDSDREGHSFVLLAARQDPPEETPTLSRSIGRVCLMLERGGMGAVYDVALDAMLSLWTLALCPEGEGPARRGGVSARVRRGWHGWACSRAPARPRRQSAAPRSPSSTSATSGVVLRVAEVLDESPRSIAARLERVRRGAVA